MLGSLLAVCWLTRVSYFQPAFLGIFVIAVVDWRWRVRCRRDGDLIATVDADVGYLAPKGPGELLGNAAMLALFGWLLVRASTAQVVPAIGLEMPEFEFSRMTSPTGFWIYVAFYLGCLIYAARNVFRILVPAWRPEPKSFEGFWIRFEGRIIKP